MRRGPFAFLAGGARTGTAALHSTPAEVPPPMHVRLIKSFTFEAAHWLPTFP